jgi:Etoposide-induced protein 2.4 (EI24)
MKHPVLQALGKAVMSQLHPKMLALLIAPFIVAITFWIAAALLFWQPLVKGLSAWLFDGTGLFGRLQGFLAHYGWTVVIDWLPTLVAFILVVPVMLASAMILIAVLAMPVVLRFLNQHGYADVARHANAWSAQAIGASLINGVLSFAIFTVGYLLTLPLWLIPPLILLVPWLWWSWFTSRVLRFDSLTDHATAAERKQMIADHRKNYFWLGLAVAALNFVPGMFIVAPVFGALAFGHYSLAALRVRRETNEEILKK